MPSGNAKTHLSANAEVVGRRRGYTLIELIIVMAIISILLATAVPMYQKSLVRTKESLLKNNLFTLRTVIDEYTFDKKKAPQTLQDLVTDGYLRAIPIDPITGNDQWRIVMEDALTHQHDLGHLAVRQVDERIELRVEVDILAFQRGENDAAGP